jgi:hypothetical protein
LKRIREELVEKFSEFGEKLIFKMSETKTKKNLTLTEKL